MGHFFNYIVLKAFYFLFAKASVTDRDLYKKLIKFINLLFSLI